MINRLRYVLRIIASLNIVQLASEIAFPQRSLLSFLPLSFIPLEVFAIWAFLTSLLLPIFVFLEIVKMNDLK